MKTKNEIVKRLEYLKTLPDFFFAVEELEKLIQKVNSMRCDTCKYWTVDIDFEYGDCSLFDETQDYLFSCAEHERNDLL